MVVVLGCWFDEKENYLKGTFESRLFIEFGILFFSLSLSLVFCFGEFLVLWGGVFFSFLSLNLLSTILLSLSGISQFRIDCYYGME